MEEFEVEDIESPPTRYWIVAKLTNFLPINYLRHLNETVSRDNKVFIICIIIWVLCFGVGIGCTILVESMGERLNGPQWNITVNVTDLGNYLLPSLPASIHLTALPDILLLCLIVAFSVALYFSESNNTRKEIICLFLRAHALLVLLRATTTVSTVSLPSPRCTQHLSGGLLNAGCYDMMFSGHTSFALLVALCSQAAFSHRLILAFKGILTALSILSILLVRDHYTADVLVAIYLTFFVFKFFERRPLFPNSAPEQALFQAVKGSSTSMRLEV